MTTAQHQGRQAPTADVFARTVPLMVEKHYFGESKSASLVPVSLDGQTKEEQARTKALLSLSKRLINSAETRQVRYRDVEFRRTLHAVATPFRPGFYLVAVDMVERAFEEAQRWESERNVLADRAEAAYPSMVQAMREPLGPMFSELDYPPPSVFRAKFWVDWKFINFGVASVLREIRADIFARETAAWKAQAAEAQDVIRQHLRAGLLDVTRHLRGLLAPKASGKRPVLRGGCLDDLTAFLDTLPARDATDDKALQQVVGQLKVIGRSLDLEILRDDDRLRDEVASEMAVVARALEAMVVEAPSRGIRLREEEVA